MKLRAKSSATLAATLAVVATGWLLAQAPTITTGGSTFFERQAGRNRTRFQGDASQFPDGRTLLKRFRMETLSEREEPELRIEAPECFFDLASKSASSSGPLKLSRADGLFSLEGRGFLWNQKENRLVISNEVRAVIRRSLFKITNAPSLPK